MRWLPTARQVEWALYLCVLTGLLLWDVVPLPWPVVSPVLVAHILGASVLMVGVVVPFWLRHRARLGFARSRQRALTGRAIEIGLVTLMVSGFYLFFVGNTGAIAGRIAHQLHLWLTFPLVGLLVVHMGRASTFVTLWRSTGRRGASRRRRG